jgi:hypothetical protein
MLLATADNCILLDQDLYLLLFKVLLPTVKQHTKACGIAHSDMFGQQL